MPHRPGLTRRGFLRYLAPHMSRYNPNSYEDDEMPWWARLAASAIGLALLAGLVELLKWAVG